MNTAAVIDEERTTMSEDVMSGAELAALVRESILRAVRGGVSVTVQEHDEGEQVIVGAGVRAVIEQTVTETIKDLLGQHVLLSGPLRDLSERLDVAVGGADEVWRLLREVEEMLSTPAVAPAPAADPVPPTASAASPPTTVTTRNGTHEPRLIAMQPHQKKCARCNVKLTSENVSQRGMGSYCVSCLAPDPAVEQVAKPVVEPTVDVESTVEPTVESTSPKQKPAETILTLTVNGITVKTNERTPAALVQFLPEFVEIMQTKGRISPAWAYARVQSLGYKANMNTFRATLDGYFGKLAKGKDERTGEFWWALPGTAS